jgi:hypothetical protein
MPFLLESSARESARRTRTKHVGQPPAQPDEQNYGGEEWTGNGSRVVMVARRHGRTAHSHDYYAVTVDGSLPTAQC